jgi:hypothetical protein
MMQAIDKVVNKIVARIFTIKVNPEQELESSLRTIKRPIRLNISRLTNMAIDIR